MVPLGMVLAIDPDLAVMLDLPPRTSAHRESADDPWVTESY